MRSKIRNLARRLPLPVKRAAIYFASRIGAVPAVVRRIRRSIARTSHPITRAWRNQRALARLSRTKQPVTLFLAPEAGLAPFFASHAILARCLNEAGHASIVLSCDGLLPICTVKFAMSMDATQVGDRDNAACRTCRQAAADAHGEYGLIGVSLESLVGMEERARISGMIPDQLDELSAMTYEGVKFGRVVVGEALRAQRKSEVSELTADDMRLAKALMFASLAIYVALRTLASRYSIKRIAYFGDYSYWITAQAFADRHGIAVTRLNHLYHRDVDRRVIGLQPTSANEHLLDQLDQWHEHRYRPIEPAMIATIADGALYRLGGHGGASTYSPNWIRRDRGLQKELGLSQERKTIVAYSSSADEYIASQAILDTLDRPYAQGPKPFPDQRAWLRGLIAWAGSRSDLQLIVRMHPRMASGHRHGSVASEYFRLKSEFSECPPNVVIIWPDERVSSYNLLEIADAVAVAWSTLGLEAARFGVPVVAAFSGIGSFPTGSFISFAETASRYFQTVETALGAHASVDHITEAFRWTYYAFWAPGVDVSDVVPAQDYGGIPPWRTPRNHKTILRVLVGGDDMSAINLARLPNGPLSEAEERRAIVDAIHRFATFFISGQDRPRLAPQRLTPEANGTVLLEFERQAIRSYSPLVHRLAILLGRLSDNMRTGLRLESAG